MQDSLILPALFAVIAALFAAVGQAGGAGYVGVMGLFGFAPASIKLAALTLTILVAGIGLIRYRMSGLLKTVDWYPFALLGVPLSLVGGVLTLPGPLYRYVVAALLLLAAAQMVRTARMAHLLDQRAAAVIPFWPALIAGGVTGLIAGITGVGAGVFLAPVMMSFHWASTRRVAAVAQASNLFTALPALIGLEVSHPQWPHSLPLWAGAVMAGGLLGAWAGAKHLPVAVLRYLLAAILFASGVKLALG
jgi:uncharacterized membrane protein YfcA